MKALLLALGPGLLLPPAGPPATFYTTYAYTAYTVYNSAEDEPPTPVKGVGGTLTLRPDGTYDKRLSLLLGNSPRQFAQHGTFRTKGDSIYFVFSDKNGPDVQRGTFRYEPRSGRLRISIVGYPPGNHGDYDLRAVPPAKSAPRP